MVPKKQSFLLSVLCLFLLNQWAFAQEFQLKGKLIDNDGIPLESATVYVEKAQDSTMVTYTISDADGMFLLEGDTNTDTLNLFVSYTGFATYKKEILVNEQPIMDLGTIAMKLSANTLGEVVVKSERAPVVIKTDTLEFNAASFKTQPDANLEDVLKQLPGVNVDNDGNITVNGKPVSRILVNGKEFFGDDPKIATKNLPKEIIDKIQVVDTKTKSEEFTGKEGDSENKTINITIEKDKNKGFFSRLTAGGGTDNRYELSGVANYFKDDLRISALGGSNNINSSGFTFDEVFDAMGRSAYSITRSSDGSFSIDGFGYGGSSGGITKSENVGLNYANEWNDKVDVNTNYFFNRASNHASSKVNRENILPDRTYYNTSTSSSTRKNDNHRARLNFEFKPDTLTRISFRPNLSVSNGFSSTTSTTASTEEDGTAINNAQTDQSGKVFNTNFTNRLAVTRKFGSKGAYVQLGFNNANSTSKEDKQYTSTREIYEAGNIEETQAQDQYINEQGREDEYELEASSRIPLFNKISLDLGYTYSNNKKTNTRLVYDREEGAEVLNENLSNDFTSSTFDHRPEVGLMYNNDTLRAKISGGFQQIQLKNKNEFTGKSFDENYTNMFLSLYAYYKISKTKSIYFRYRNSRQAPSINQLQPVVNTTNPLNVITGNPNLNPSFNHNFYANFNNYNYQEKTGFYVYLGGNVINDQVVSFTTTDENLLRTTTYTNVNGFYRTYGGVSLDKSIKLKNENSFKISLGVHGDLNRNVGFSNGVQYNSKTYGISPNVGLQYDVPEIITIEPSYNISFNNTKYSLDRREESYKNHTLNAQITSYWPKNFVFGNDISYRHIGNVSPGFKDNYVLWNMSLGYKLLGDDGIVKVKVFDVLNENISTSRYTGEDFIQDTQQLVLEQYVMFSFTYKFSKFAGKAPNRSRRR